MLGVVQGELQQSWRLTPRLAAVAVQLTAARCFLQGLSRLCSLAGIWGQNELQMSPENWTGPIARAGNGQGQGQGQEQEEEQQGQQGSKVR